MKSNPKALVYQTAQKLTLPAEVFGASAIEISGHTQVLLSGHKGIRAYGMEETVVDMPYFAVTIRGSDLRISAMTKSELLIRGELSQIIFAR